MPQLESFSIEQLGLFVTLILGSLSACLLVCFKSRCDVISTPCLKIHRKPLEDNNNNYNNNNNNNDIERQSITPSVETPRVVPDDPLTTE